MKTILTIAIFLTCLETIAQAVSDNGKWRPLVNQAGYNLGESKRFVCYGAPDGTKYSILKASGDGKVYEGEIVNHEVVYQQQRVDGSHFLYVRFAFGACARWKQGMKPLLRSRGKPSP